MLKVTGRNRDCPCFNSNEEDENAKSEKIKCIKKELSLLKALYIGI